MGWFFGVYRSIGKVITIFVLLFVSSASLHAVEMNDSSSDAAIPAGVVAGQMVSPGKWMVGYMSHWMRMQDNYIGSDLVSPSTIVTTIPSNAINSGMGGGHPLLRVVPQNMDVRVQMLNLMMGITEHFNLMVMSSYVDKAMGMSTYKGTSGSQWLGSSSAESTGWGDTQLYALVKLYQTAGQSVHASLGVSVPTGSTTQTMTMLSPMNKQMTMRGSYGMQLGTGSYDLLPGLTYTGHLSHWSWGGEYRARVSVSDNAQGYRYGNANWLGAWAGFEVLPGLTLTARMLGSSQDPIRGGDPQISGLMEGDNPTFIGGKMVSGFLGMNLSGRLVGMPAAHLAIEGGRPFYQNLNGPQLGLGTQWIGSLRFGF